MSEDDATYLNLISSRLRNFKRKSGKLWNFSCPICGDSDKDRRKARGYVYKSEGSLHFKCHNCGNASSFSYFLKNFDAELYAQYRLEKLGENKKRKFKEIKSVYKPKKRLVNLPSIHELDKDHPAKIYCVERLVSEDSMKRIYYSDDFHRFVDGHCMGKYSFKTDQRIVFPLTDPEGNLIGAQGRVFTESDKKNRFITTSFGDEPLCFGFDKIDLRKLVYVVEGSFDSLFLPNCIAVLSSSLNSCVGSLRKFYGVSFDCVLIHDNEPRNFEIATITHKALPHHKVCIWPERVKEKDINDMVKSGIDVKTLIDVNTFSYPLSGVKFSKWCKLKLANSVP